MNGQIQSRWTNSRLPRAAFLAIVTLKVAAGTAPPSTAHGQCYEITAIIEGPACAPPFDDPPPTRATGLRTNAEGEVEVFGYYTTCEIGPDLPFVWTATSGLVTIIPPGDAGTAKPYDGANGVLVGEMAGLTSPRHAFVYDGTMWNDLGTGPGGNFSVALGTDSSGNTVAGYWGNNVAGPGLQAFYWEKGMSEIVNLSAVLPGPSAVANDVSNGQVVGWMGNSNLTDAHAFIYDIATGRIADLGPIPGGYTSEAYAMNACGSVTGDGLLPNPDGHLPLKNVFLFTASSGMVDLGGLPGFMLNASLDITDDGTIVGRSWYTPENPNLSHAFLYDGTFQDINDLIVHDTNVVITIASAMDELGRIAGYGSLEGHAVGVLLSPVPGSNPDFNSNGAVGPDDLAALLASWGSCSKRDECFGDFDCSGSIDASDLATLLANWS